MKFNVDSETLMLEDILISSYLIVGVVLAGFWGEEEGGFSLVMGMAWPFFALLKLGVWLREITKP